MMTPQTPSPRRAGRRPLRRLIQTRQATRPSPQQQRSSPAPQGVPDQQKNPLAPSGPPTSGPTLRIIPLGGQEEVGRNMTVFEYGNDIVLLDMGLQFPEEDMPGVDYIIPDVRYLKGKERRIRGVILSHGHLDHIGATPHLLQQLGWPTVYASQMTLALVKRRLEESRLDRFLKAEVIESPRQTLHLGAMTIRFFEVTHSIMDALGVIVQTPVANVIHLGDWRYELKPVSGKPTDFTHLAQWNTPRTPSILMMESLGSTKEGHQISESEVFQNMKNVIEKAPGRVVVATFASMVERVGWLIQIAETLGKKVALDGYSMKLNVEIAKKVGYLKFKPTTLIDIRNISDYPDNKVLIVCTGAQGEERAVLSRIAAGEHRWLKVKRSDTIVFSSSVIPGNERTIQRLKDILYRQCDSVIHKEVMDVHGGGHALIGDIKLLLRQVKPRYLLPVYANHYLLKEAGKVAQTAGIAKEDIFYLDNGSVFEARKREMRVLPKKIPIEYVFVDGLGVGDVSHVVLRDRQMMSSEGMFVIVTAIDARQKKVRGEPNIISRGFIHVRESKGLLAEARRRVKAVVDRHQTTKGPLDFTHLRDAIREDLGKFFFEKTERRPMVLPVIIEV